MLVCSRGSGLSWRTPTHGSRTACFWLDSPFSHSWTADPHNDVSNVVVVTILAMTWREQFRLGSSWSRTDARTIFFFFSLSSPVVRLARVLVRTIHDFGRKRDFVNDVRRGLQVGARRRKYQWNHFYRSRNVSRETQVLQMASSSGYRHSRRQEMKTWNKEKIRRKVILLKIAPFTGQTIKLAKNERSLQHSTEQYSWISRLLVMVITRVSISYKIFKASIIWQIIRKTATVWLIVDTMTWLYNDFSHLLPKSLDSGLTKFIRQ